MDASSMQLGFALDLRAHRVVWSTTVRAVLADELRAVEARRFLLISSRDLAIRFDAHADEAVRYRMAGRFTDVVPHVPHASVLAAVEAARCCQADSLLVFGGGSSLDTAKAVSDQLHLPILAIPTNFSGSEVTWNFGLTINNAKQTIRNPAVLPKTVIYSPSLLTSLPLELAICSGLNAVAHAVEALYAPNANPLTQSLAETGIRKMMAGLQVFAAIAGQTDEHAGKAAALCLTGSWMCGEVLSQVGMGLHHRICHILGGTLGLPHAQAHTVLLPYSIEWHIDYAPGLAPLAGLFPGCSLASGFAAFSVRHGAPASLAELGLRAAQIPEVAALALAAPVATPRPVTEADVQAMLARAHAGDLAATSTQQADQF